MDKKEIENLFKYVILNIEGVECFSKVRVGLQETPRRIAEMYVEMFNGYTEDANDLITIFKEKHDEVIISKDMEFYSFCEHHILPFYGTVDIAYLPGDTILGISKLARIVDHFSHRLNIQEKMTTDIADFIMGSKLKPRGVMVIIRATHLCEVMRGVKKKNPIMITSAVRGSLLENPNLRNEVIMLIRNK